MEKFCKPVPVAFHGIREPEDRSLAEVEAEHRADAVKCEGQSADGLTGQRFERRADFLQLRPSLAAFEFAQLGKSGGHGDGISGQSPGLVNGSVWRELVHDVRASAKRSDGKTAANHFSHGGEVGADPENFLRPATRETESGHHLVKYQEGTSLCAKGPQVLQIARLRKIKAGIGGDRFEDDGGNFSRIRGESGARGLDVVKRNGDGEPGQRLRHAGAVRGSVGESPAPGFYKEGIHVPVVAALKFEDFVAPGESPREAHATHRRFGATIHHADFFH